MATPKRTGGVRVTAAVWADFLRVLSETCNVTHACREAGVDRNTAYEHRAKSAPFAAAWEAAKALALEALEDEMHRRAFLGTDKPVYQGGIEVGTIREYSDTLAIFLAKAHAPAKYRERTSHELSGPGGGPLRTVIEFVYTDDDSPETSDDDDSDVSDV